MTKLVTFETVSDAVDALVAAGKKVTLRALRDEIGGGSLTDVSRHFAQLRAGRPLVRVADIELDKGIAHAIAAQMQRVADQAAAAVKERLSETQESVLAITDELRHSEQKIEALELELQSARGVAEEFAETLRQLKIDTERRAAIYADDNDELRHELAKERARADRSASELARAEVRLETLPVLQAEIAHLRSTLESQSSARVAAEQSVAVLGARLEAAERRADEARDLARVNADRAEKATAALAETAQELALARVSAQVPRGAVDTTVESQRREINSKAGTKPGLESGVPKAAGKKA